jgi:hypothetical protein
VKMDTEWNKTIFMGFSTSDYELHSSVITVVEVWKNN